MKEIHDACLKFDVERVRQLIDGGADVNDDGYVGLTSFDCRITPLMIISLAAILVPHTAEDERRLIKLLLDSGADPNHRLTSGTALEIAIFAKDGARHINVHFNVLHIIIEHVTEVEAKTNKRVFSNYNIALINKDSELKEYYRKCQDELMAMWCIKIEGTSITYFSVLMEPLDVVARFAKNKKFVEGFEAGSYQSAYPIYASRLREKFDAAVARQKKMEQVFTTLSRTLQFADPSNLIFENICKYLSEEDFNLLIEN